MKVVTIAAAKGGTGKTTVTAALAVRASLESTRVAMFDLNADQGDLTNWWVLRGEPMNPRTVDVENIARDVEVLRTEGFEWLFIDCPPVELDIIEAAVVKSDAVVIPVRPSQFDITGVTPVVEMCKARHKPYGFLLSAVDTKMPKLVEKARAALVADGPILDARITYRQSWITAIPRGKTGPEVDKELQPEIEKLWEAVKRLAASSIPLAAVKGRSAS